MLRRVFFAAVLAALVGAPAQAEPIKALIITGDNITVHDWKASTASIKEILSQPAGKFQVDVTTTPAKDLNDEKLASYDVLILNYFPTAQGGPDTKWTDANKAALLKAVKDGKGVVAHHFASAAFARPNWEEYEKMIAGGWRTQGFHGPAHEFSVKRATSHPISDASPEKFAHPTDELYSNNLLTPGSIVIATAYCDPSKPKGTGKDEAVIWVNQYGKGRVYNNVLGHDSTAMADKAYGAWFRNGVEWAATGQVKAAK